MTTVWQWCRRRFTAGPRPRGVDLLPRLGPLTGTAGADGIPSSGATEQTDPHRVIARSWVVLGAVMSV